MIVQRGVSDATPPITTPAYWTQVTYGLPSWAWMVLAAAVVYFWPVSERERATGKPFGLGKQK